MAKTWFITGTSRGLGREFAIAALGRGDRVAATARDTGPLDDLAAAYPDLLLPITLDVTDRPAAAAAVERAHEHFGRLDVVVNNAGYGHFGFVEELDPDDLRAQLETNLFGVLNVTQAALPFLRAQGNGHIVNVSSIGGVVAVPYLGAYHASKWALEGLSESLAQEVRPFGIAVTIVEPGGFSTDFAGSSAARSAASPDYDELRAAVLADREAAAADRGDPTAPATALLRLVDADEPPLRLLLGATPPETVKRVYADRLRTWVEWEPVSIAAQG